MAAESRIDAMITEPRIEYLGKDVKLKVYISGTHFEVYTEAGTGSIQGFCRQAPEPEPDELNDGPTTRNFIRKRRQICRRDHLFCRTNDHTWKPQRLLKIVNDGLVLVDTNDVPGPMRYIALSYCWGKKESICTNSKNISQFRTLIPTQSIPIAIRDAISIASNTGEEYLWIDRFCIQQDDSEDWASTSQIMGKIYELAEFVVVAASSASVNDPFLGECSASGRLRSSTFAIDGNAWAYHGEEQFRRPQLRLRNCYAKLQGCPLDARAWTFQEALLATRCIRYEHEEVKRKCKTSECTESGEEHSTKELILTGRSTWSQWSDRVYEYSQRDITTLTDKLPALSGVAARYSGIIGGRYLAGLWEKHLPQNLSWRTAEPSMFREQVPGVPSWSWASLMGQIDSQQQWATIWDRSWDDTVPQTAKVKDIQCSPSTENTYGSVMEGSFIELECLTIDVGMCQNEEKNGFTCETLPGLEHYKEYRMDLTLDGHIEALRIPGSNLTWQRARCPVATDHDPEVRVGVKLAVLAMNIVEGDNSVKGSFLALVLSPAQSMPGAWCRIGRFGLDAQRNVGEDFMKYFREETVKIV